LAAKKSSQRAAKPSAPPAGDEGESRAAVAVTVAWMLTLMSTTVAFALAMAAWGALLAFPAPRGASHTFGFLPNLLLFVSGTTGILCLVLTLVAHRVRATPPPRAITIAAALIGVAPLVTIAILALRG
jgi:hypothetical protein